VSNFFIEKYYNLNNNHWNDTCPLPMTFIINYAILVLGRIAWLSMTIWHPRFIESTRFSFTQIRELRITLHHSADSLFEALAFKIAQRFSVGFRSVMATPFLSFLSVLNNLGTVYSYVLDHYLLKICDSHPEIAEEKTELIVSKGCYDHWS